MKIKVSCEDKYEAQKLASLIFIKDAKETFITSILNVFQNEVVVALKDKSAHSIVLKDESHVEIFADFIQSVIDIITGDYGVATFQEISGGVGSP